MPKPPPLSFRPVSHRRVEHPGAAALAQKGAARVATKSTLVHFPLALYQKLRLSAIAKDIPLRELTRTTLETWVQEDVGECRSRGLHHMVKRPETIHVTQTGRPENA